MAKRWVELFAEVHVVRPRQLSVGPLRVRWGSCTHHGRLRPNSDLIRHARPSIEYIVAHGLRYLIEPNHTRAFWALLARMLPDWEARKEALERGR